jgi:hypothetical protein
MDKTNDAWTWAIDRYVTLSKRRSELMGMDVKADEDQNRAQVVVREVPAGYWEGPKE